MFWHPLESARQIPIDGMKMKDNIKFKNICINLYSQQLNIRIFVFLSSLPEWLLKNFTIFQPDK